MSEAEQSSRRSTTRFLTDLDIELFDVSGGVLDDHAQAHDVSPKGFRAETKANLKEGDSFRFSLRFEDEGPIMGQAEVVWTSQSQWGGHNIGGKITKISWRDRRRLQANLYRPGYNFASLAKKALVALYWIVICAGLNNVMFHQTAARKILLDLIPVLVALFFFGWGLILLFRRD